jgi:polar amino acid transport system substrate-binding protein
MPPILPSLRDALAPAGCLRAAINLGNPVLAHRSTGGEAGGVSVDLARELARVLGVPLDLVSFDAAGKSVEAVSSDQADVGFFAIDPLRGAQIAFTAPYVLIEGFYMVRDASPVRSNADIDVAANRVVVGKGSAYDLFLTRALQHAQIVRAATSAAVVAAFLASGAEVAAGVKQQLERDGAEAGGLRLLGERFMVIRQAMGVPKSRGPDAAVFLAAFVEDMKANGFVAAALQRHGIAGAVVAPPQ